MSVTLTSRRRLACNGTLESVTRLLGKVMATDSPEGVASGATDGLDRREAMRNMVNG